MAPRVLMVRPGPDFDGVERVIAGDGETALTLLRRERFDTVLVDLALAPLDGWYVLATVGGWAERPRLVAIVVDRAEIGRARLLGADLCMTAGTHLHARALERSTKEMPCPRPRATNFRRATRTGVSA